MGNIYNNGNNRYTGYVEGIYGSFIYKVKQTVYKWWCVVYKPVYKLTHNGYFPPEKEPDNKYPSEPDNANSEVDQQKLLAEQMAKEMADKIMSEHNNVSEFIPDINTDSNEEQGSSTSTDNATSNIDNVAANENTSDEDDIMNKLSSIMDANKVDIAPFIEEGKANLMEQQAKEQQIKDEQVSEASDDALLRAQEIMDRLNREAAEDEAKKQAEIDEAKRAAGVL